MKKIMLVAGILLTAMCSYSQWIKDSVSVARAGIPIAVFKNKMLLGSSAGNAWDIFDLRSGTHASGIFSLSRTEIQFAQAGNNAYFGGGKYGYFTDPQYAKNVDVYNATTNTWSVLNLSLARSVGGAGAVGNNVFFAGGIGRQDISGPVYLYNRVDIFNAVTGARTNARLSKARTNIAVAVAGNKILFAGGWFWDMSYNQVQTDAVDIYDNTTAAWSVAKLSKKRESMAVAVIGSKVLFAGGYNYISGPSNVVDIYDAATNTWTATAMSGAHYGMLSAVVGTKAYFAGGVEANNIIEVYDASNGTWSTITMPINLTRFSASVLGDDIYFAGGYDPTRYSLSNQVQVYNTITSTWNILLLSQSRYAISSAPVKGKVIFAGGYLSFGATAMPASRIDVYTPPVAFTAAVVADLKQDNRVTKIFPNPANDYLFISFNQSLKAGAVITVYDINGKLLLTQQVAADISLVKLPVNRLQKGLYLFSIMQGGKKITGKFVKE